MESAGAQICIHFFPLLKIKTFFSSWGGGGPVLKRNLINDGLARKSTRREGGRGAGGAYDKWFCWQFSYFVAVCPKHEGYIPCRWLTRQDFESPCGLGFSRCHLLFSTTWPCVNSFHFYSVLRGFCYDIPCICSRTCRRFGENRFFGSVFNRKRNKKSPGCVPAKSR